MILFSQQNHRLIEIVKNICKIQQVESFIFKINIAFIKKYIKIKIEVILTYFGKKIYKNNQLSLFLSSLSI
jgi:hypothetical protein